MRPSFASLRVRSLEICTLAEPAACVLALKCLCMWGVRTTSHRPVLVASGASLPSPLCSECVVSLCERGERNPGRWHICREAFLGIAGLFGSWRLRGLAEMRRLGHRALSLAVRVRQTMRETMLRVRDQLLHARTLRSTASFKRSIRLFLSRFGAQNLLKQHCAKEATRRTASHMRRALRCWGVSRRRHSCQASRL